jgi:truncated hemoglobin YjbI
MLGAADADAIRGAVERFLELATAERALDRYWADVDLGQRRWHARTFVLHALGVPDATASDLAASHRPLGIDDDVYDRVLAALETSLREAGVSDDVVVLALRRADELRPRVVNEDD